jgi:septal ring factor EnvC (AmiA/AmiB activator)
MADVGVLEMCGIFAALSAGLGGPVAVIRWCGGQMDKKVAESEKSLNLSMSNHGHKLANVATRMDSIEREHQHIERTVRLETNLQNLEKGQERIEHQLEKMEADGEKGRAEIIESLRELRIVSLKD